jgi:hypothetical protein
MYKSTADRGTNSLPVFERSEYSSFSAYTFQNAKQLCRKGLVQNSHTESGFVENIGT